MGTSGEGMDKLPEGMPTNAAGGFECGFTHNSNGRAGGGHRGGRGRHERAIHVTPILTAAKSKDTGEIDMAETAAGVMGFILARLLPQRQFDPGGIQKNRSASATAFLIGSSCAYCNIARGEKEQAEGIPPTATYISYSVVQSWPTLGD